MYHKHSAFCISGELLIRIEKTRKFFNWIFSDVEKEERREDFTDSVNEILLNFWKRSRNEDADFVDVRRPRIPSRFRQLCCLKPREASIFSVFRFSADFFSLPCCLQPMI